MPIGIEKVLYLAASNEPFRRRLLEDRRSALETLTVRLTDVERTTLLTVSRAALETMVSRLSPARRGGRALLRTVAAASVSLAAGLAASGCGDDSTPGPDAEEVGEVGEVRDADAAREDADAREAVDVDAVVWDIPDACCDGMDLDTYVDPGWMPEADAEVEEDDGATTGAEADADAGTEAGEADDDVGDDDGADEA